MFILCDIFSDIRLFGTDLIMREVGQIYMFITRGLFTQIYQYHSKVLV